MGQEERERPSADQLCERIAALNELRECSVSSESERSCGNERVHNIQDAVRALQDQLEAKEVSLQQKDALIATEQDELRECREENQRLRKEYESSNEGIQQLERNKTETVQENMDKARQLNRVHYQLERVIADFERRVIELEGQLRLREQSHIQRDNDRSGADSKADIKLRWRGGENAPCEMDRSCDAVIRETTMYCMQLDVDGVVKIYAYTTTTSYWSLTPPCPVRGQFAIAVINNTLTSIGGYGHDMMDTNKLFSLNDTGESDEKSWIEEFPHMPTKRIDVSALVIGTALIVVGGVKDMFSRMKIVEVLNISTGTLLPSRGVP